jgi:hypothetical protein
MSFSRRLQQEKEFTFLSQEAGQRGLRAALAEKHSMDQ